MVRGAGLGAAHIFLRVAVRNPYSGKEITLSGQLVGGQAATSVKDSFKFDKTNPRLKTIGREVSFLTRDALFFQDFDNVMVRLGKAEVAFGLKTKMTYLVFTDLDTVPPKDMLIFDHKSFGLGFIKADAFLAFGRLKMDGPNPGDWIELPSPPDIIPTTRTHHVNDGLLLSFPTGKAGLNELTPKDRQRLKAFVTNKARAIAALSESFRYRR